MVNLISTHVRVMLSLFFFMGLCAVNAQGSRGGLLVRQAGSGLEIVSVSDAGDILQVEQALPDYGFTSDSAASWLLHPAIRLSVFQAIVLSPDGEKLAFVASQGDNQFRLVIYRQDTGTLIEESLPGYAFPVWSPDSETVLLEMRFAPAPATLPESSIYFLNSGTFQTITNDTTARESDFQWLPDGNRIIYQKNRDIFVTSLDNLTPRQLTQIAQQIESDITPTLCQMTWSENVQRVYFTVGCADGIDYLYSVDLNGQVRLELSLVELYAESYRPSFEPVAIAAIFPSISSDTLFILVRVKTANPVNTSQNTTLAIHHLTAPQTTNLIYEEVLTVDNARGISASAISPDSTFIVFASGKQDEAASYVVQVIDISNGMVIAEQINLQAVCDIDWLSSQTLAYEEIETINCFERQVASQIVVVHAPSNSRRLLSTEMSMLAVPFRYQTSSDAPLPVITPTATTMRSVTPTATVVSSTGDMTLEARLGGNDNYTLDMFSIIWSLP